METEALLDTHVLVWLYAGELDLFSVKARGLLENSPLFMSPMSLLEIDYLFEIKKITVRGMPVYRDLNEKIGLQLASDSFFEIVQEAAQLRFTRDPFDRIITAHAKLRGSLLMTKDRTLQKHYSRCVW